MDLLEAVKAKAIFSVVSPNSDKEYFGRYVRRWYSRTFHTPLHTVDDIPMLDIFQHYYECLIEGMEPEERVEHIAEILMTDEERKQMSLEQDASDVGTAELLRQAAEENSILDKTIPIQPEPLQVPSMREAELPIQTILQPNIEMKFISLDELETEMNGWGDLAPPPKR